MAARFYDPNDTEQRRLLRAAQNGDLESRRFTDSVGRSGFETIDGDLRMRRYDSGQTHFEQRGPGGEMRAFGPTTSPSDLVAPPTGPVIAPDRTERDRMARAMLDSGVVDRGPQYAAQAAAARMGFTRDDMPRGWQGNVHDFDHERSFGTNAVIGARARGFGGPPTAIETFGNEDERGRIERAVEDRRMAWLEQQAAGGPMSAAGGTRGQEAARRELEAIRLRRAQEENHLNAMLIADRDAGARELAALYGMQGQVGAARETATGVRDAATANAGATKEVGLAQAGAQKEVGLAQASRPVPLATQGGVTVQDPQTGEWKTTLPETKPAAGEVGRYTMGKDGTIFDTTTGQRAEGLSEAQTIDIQLAELRKPPTGYVSKEDLAFRQKQIDALMARKRELEEERARAAAGAAPSPAAGSGRNTDYR